MNNYGFIITRHVNSVKTNKYWNQCVKLIRTFYPFKKIVIIDDNSNKEFVNPHHEYKNIEIINSEYPGRGELLPYIYYLRHKWFNNAVIIHDSVFIHRHIPFEILKMPVMPLWHHTYDKENLQNLIRIASALNNNYTIINKLIKRESINVLGFGKNKDNFDLCFGTQCFINIHFLELLERKYKITNLVNVIRNRTDRCGLERIMGLLFCQEFTNLSSKKSLFGNIFTHHCAFDYEYEHYYNDLQRGKVPNAFVKVWTGR
jgi:hypothetical protein